MPWNFFDSIKPGLLLSLLFETFLLLGWAFKPDRFRKVWLWAGPVLFVALEWFVETDREQLVRITREIVRAAQEEDAPAIIARLDDEFSLPNGFNKEQAAAAIRDKLDAPLIASNVITQLEVTRILGDRGQVRLTVLTTLETKNKFGPSPYPIKTTWLFDYLRRAPGDPFKAASMTMIDSNTGKPFDVFKFKGRF